MNILSKNNFAVIVSGIFYLSFIVPVFAQKQNRSLDNSVAKTFARKKAQINRIQLGRIHSRFQPKIKTAQIDMLTPQPISKKKFMKLSDGRRVRYETQRTSDNKIVDIVYIDPNKPTRFVREDMPEFINLTK